MTQISILCFNFIILSGLFALGLQFFNIKLGKHLEFLIGIIFLTAFTLMAYRMWPGEGSDLSRYFYLITDMEFMSIKDIFEFGRYRNNILTNLLMWAIAKTGNNYLFPAIGTFLTISNLLYLISLEKKRVFCSFQTELSFLLVIFAVVSLLAITSGVRQAWMLSVFAIAVYRDLILNKRNLITFLLYFAAIMIHTAAIVPIAVRLFSAIKGNFKFLFLPCILLFPSFEDFSFGNAILNEASSSFFSYKTIGWEGLTPAIMWLRIGIIAILMFIWWNIRNSSKNLKYINFYISLLLFTIISIPVPHLFSRMINVVSFTSLPILNEFFRIKGFSQVLLCKMLLAVFCFGLFCYQYVLIKAIVSFV